MRLLRHQSTRFLSVGVLNTLHGYAWIFGIQVITGQPVLANMLGYGVAAGFGFLAHSRYTFRQSPSVQKAGAYLLVVAGSYLVNLMVLAMALRVLPAMLAQFVAVSAFVGLSYLGQSRFVFTRRPQ